MKLTKALFVGALAVAAAAAVARPTHGSTTTYYSDASHTVEIGGTEVVANLPSYGVRIPDRGETVRLRPLATRAGCGAHAHRRPAPNRIGGPRPCRC